MQVSGKKVQVHLKSESLLSKTDLTIESLVSHVPSFIGDSEESKNNSLTPVRSRALSDLLSSSAGHHATNLPVLEPIKIQSTEIQSTEDGSSDSEPEDKGNFELAYDSDDDSEPEADRQINKVRDEGGGKCMNHTRNWNKVKSNLVR